MKIMRKWECRCFLKKFQKYRVGESSALSAWQKRGNFYICFVTGEVFSIFKGEEKGPVERR